MNQYEVGRWFTYDVLPACIFIHEVHKFTYAFISCPAFRKWIVYEECMDRAYILRFKGIDKLWTEYEESMSKV